MDSDEGKRTKRNRFLREIGSIVLGVLIALTLGAGASEIGWALDVRNAKAAIAEELGEIVGQGRERQRVYPCIERKLDSIAMILAQADASGRLAPVGSIGDPPWRTWSHNVWDSTIGSDTAGHFDRGTLDNISGVYEFVTIINRYSESEMDAWRRLFAIVGPGRSVDRDEIVNLRDALSSAHLSNRLITGSSMRIDQIVKAYDLPVSEEDVAKYGNAPIDRYCTPIEAASGGPYGDSTMGGMVTRVANNPITSDSAGIPKK